MIALKNTTNNQIFYIIHKRMNGGDIGWDLQPLVIEYTENGQYSINPPSGYDGFSSVNVTVDVEQGECNLTTSTVTLTGEGEHTILPPEGYDGFSEVVVNVESDCEDAYDNGVADQKAKLASTTFTENGSYNREDGWNAVQVNVDTVTPYNEGVEDGKDAQKALMTSLTAVSNGTYTREDGYNEVVVNVPSDVNNQTKQVTYTQNGTQTVLADSGYSGLGQVAVTVNVDTTTPYNNGKQDGIDEQKAKLTSATFTANDTYTRADGWDEVTVNVDTVTPYNNGYAAGKQDGIDEQKAKLISGTFTQNGTFNREDGYNQVIVNVPSDVNNQNKTVNPSTSQQIVTANQGYSGLGQVTVNAVTAAIDPDIQPENIKKDVVILGVTGTYDPQPDLEAKSITYSSNGTYTISPTAGKDGLSGVTVTVDVQCTGGDQLDLTRYTIDVVSDNDFPTEGINYPIGVYSSASWTVTSKPNWVTVDSNSGNTGISLLNVNVDSIEDGRTGTITITNGTITKTITINQTEYASRYLTLEVTSPGTLYWKQYGSQYSRVLQFSTSGTNWTSITSITTNDGCLVGSFGVGDKIMFKSATPSFTPSSTNYHYFVFTNGLKGNISGNISSFPKPYDLFKGCTGIQSAEHLVVPEGFSCTGLFSGCTGLTTAPKSLPTGYYKGMFNGCTKLVNAPELPSTELGTECYLNMFYGCTSLTTAPELPATTLTESCYANMFYGCSSLTKAPELPATTLAKNCYNYMFRGCTSLTTAPVLPATTLVQSCYGGMFYGCTSLNYIKAMFTTTPSSTYTANWVSNVNSTGTFVKNSAATWTTTGNNGVPTGWTVQTASA